MAMQVKRLILESVSAVRTLRVAVVSRIAVAAVAIGAGAYYLLAGHASPSVRSLADTVVVHQRPSIAEKPPAAEANGASLANEAFKSDAVQGGGTARPTTAVALSRALQARLRRANCYDGPINGTWSRQSKNAMGRFVAMVNATLPVEQPDQILLALLESNPTASCLAGQSQAHAAPATPPPAARMEALSSDVAAPPPAPISTPLAATPRDPPRFSPVALATLRPGEVVPPARRASRMPVERSARPARRVFAYHAVHQRRTRAGFDGVQRSADRNFRALKRVLLSIVH